MIEIIKNYLEVKLEYLQYLHELIQPTSPSKPAWMQANGLISKTTGGSDKGVMKLETEVGEGSGRRHLPSFVPLFAGNGGGRDLGRETCHPPPPMRCYCYRWLIPPSEVLFNSTREILHHSIHDSEHILLLLHFDRVVNCGWKVCLCVWLYAG